MFLMNSMFFVFNEIWVSDLMCALALRQTRSFIQAAEMFHRAQNHLVSAYATRTPYFYVPKQRMLSLPIEIRHFCAKLELLAADVLQQHTHQVCVCNLDWPIFVFNFLSSRILTLSCLLGFGFYCS